MGNFKNHLDFAVACVIILETLIIWWLLDDVGLWLLLSMVGVFMIGAIAPDVDLPHEKRITKVLFFLLFPVVGYIISKKSSHWGRVHSIIFGLLLSLFLFIVLALLPFSTGSAFWLALSFFAGYINHLFCDQLYHIGRLKKGGKYALKLYSNEWRYDPLIILWKKLEDKYGG